MKAAFAFAAVAVLASFVAHAEPPPPVPPVPPLPPPLPSQVEMDKAIAEAQRAAGKVEKRRHHGSSGLSIRLSGGNIRVDDDDDMKVAQDGDEAKDGKDGDDAKDGDDGGAGSDPGHDSAAAGDDDGDESVIANLPPDVRDRLTGEQIESILRRRTDRHSESIAATVAPAMFFLTVIAIVIAVIMGRHRRDRVLHETLRAMIEKGVEIPDTLLMNGKKPGSDRRRAIILGAAGVGLTICILAMNGVADGSWAIGLVPVLIGAGYFVAWYLEERRGGGRG
jgi:hypothetical protein